MTPTKTYRIKQMAVGLVMLLIWGLTPAAADTAAPDLWVFDRINQYREAPHAHAVALGYDPLYLAEIGIPPETQLAPYVLDAALDEAAAAANARVASPEPLDPPPPQRQRMRETGAVLTFTHFIPAETAGSLFVENLFKTELNTGDFAFILSNDMTHAGVSLAPGIMEGKNAWFFSLVIGTVVRTADIQMLTLINQVRANPSLISFYLPARLPEVFQHNWQIYHLATLQFPPVFFDEFLYHCARADVLGPVLQEGMDNPAELPGTPAVGMPLDFDGAVIQETGIPEPVNPLETWAGEFFDTATAAVSWENMAVARPVTDLFTALLHSEVSTWPYGSVIFSNHYTEAGTFFAVTPGAPVETVDPPESFLQPGTGVVTLCAGSAALPETGPEVSQTTAPETPVARIYGVLFADHDDDTVYAAGEEMSGEAITVLDNTFTLAATVVTDSAGHFSLALEPGRHWIFEAWRGEQVARQIIFIEQDHFVKLGFRPQPQPIVP